MTRLPVVIEGILGLINNSPFSISDVCWEIDELIHNEQDTILDKRGVELRKIASSVRELIDHTHYEESEVIDILSYIESHSNKIIVKPPIR